MSEILLIVPSRGRPHNADRLVRAWQATTEGLSELRFLVDNNDPTRWDYPEDYTDIGIPGRLAALTNRCARRSLHYRLLGSIGDDHVPETLFESALLEAAGDVGIAFGDDGVHHERIPTAFFVTSNIVRELGGMGPPGVQHLFFDDWARELGNAAGCLRYLPDVKITHWHPIVNKAPIDATYLAGGENKVLFASDKRAYEAWLANGLQPDAAKIRALRKVHV